MGKELYMALSEEDPMEEAWKMVVKRRNKLVNRMKPQSMVKGGDEPITSFETGRFKVMCDSTA